MNHDRRAVLSQRLECSLPLIGSWLRHLAIRRLCVDRAAPETVPILARALRHTDAYVRARAREALSDLASQPAIDALCAEWFFSRDTESGRLIGQRGYIASEPTDVRVFSGLKAARLGLLREEAVPAIPHLLAAVLDSDAEIAQSAQQLLCALDSQAAIDALCAEWFRSRFEEAGRLVRECRYVASGPGDLRVWSTLKSGQSAPLRNGSDAVGYVLMATHDPDPEVAKGAEEVLRGLESQEAIDALCIRWFRSRNPVAATLIRECEYVASGPADVRVYSALAGGQLALLKKEDAEAVGPLLSATKDQDAGIANAARHVLRGLERQCAQDAIIDIALASTEPAALIYLIDTCGYRHSDEGRWFLYLALAGRFDEYLAADFEFQTLAIEFRAAHADLQNRIRERIVASGDTRMSGLLVRGHPSARLSGSSLAGRHRGELTDADAHALVRVLSRNRNWESLFTDYLGVLPARRLAEAVRAMTDAGWEPPEQDARRLLEHLNELLPSEDQIPEPVFLSSCPNPVIVGLLAEGKERPPADTPEALQAMIGAEAPPGLPLLVSHPPETQIRALGALLARKALTPEILRKAATAPAWTVRLTAAMLGAANVDDTRCDGAHWLSHLNPALEAERLWSVKAFQFSRDGLDALLQHLAKLDDPRRAGGLPLVAAVAAHAIAHDIEIDTETAVEIDEDAFEIES